MPQTEKLPSVKEYLSYGREVLTSHGLDSSEAELILSAAAGVKRSTLYLEPDTVIGKKAAAEYKRILRERCRRIPLQYITGVSCFMGLDFAVTKDTLIPRPETELLVEDCIGFLRGIKNPSVLELGTGCGNIAVSLAALTNCEVVSVDINTAALDVARGNAGRHGVSGKISFLQENMLKFLKSFPGEFSGKFDLLVSNPPYVSEAEYAQLEEEVRKEPAAALLAGADGMKYISEILHSGPGLVRDGGMMLIETGCGQALAVLKAAASIPWICGAEYKKDYGGKDRIFSCKVIRAKTK